MTAFMLAPDELQIESPNTNLGSYEFGTNVAHHYFCSTCGIYPFHETMRKPGHYRVNLGCVDGVNSLELPCDVFDGQAL